MGRRKIIIEDDNDDNRKKKKTFPKWKKKIKDLERQKKTAWISYFNTRDELFKTREILKKAQDELKKVEQENDTFEAPKHIMDLIKKSIEKEDCCICFDKITKETVYITKCGHFFCHICLKGWFKNKHKTCPCCRAYISTKI